MTSFMTVGCTDALVAKAIDKVQEEFDDDEQTETSADTLTMIKTSNGFSMTWDKKDTEFNEVIYRNNTNESREAIMEGSTAIQRTYQCVFDVDNAANVEYLCTGMGTPELGDSEEGEVTLTFEKETDYAFVDGALLLNFVNYNNGILLINGE